MEQSKYVSFVRSKPGSFVAKKLGLPHPVDLPRFAERPQPVLDPVLVLGHSEDAERVAKLILDWDGHVRRHDDGAEKYGSIIVVADDIATPHDFGPIIHEMPAAVKRLKPGGRVVTLSRTADVEDVALNSARSGVEGFIRTIAKESRKGVTANGILVDDGVDMLATSVEAALRFFLSAKSAFVTGQTIRVSTDDGTAPAVWDRPLAGKVALVTGAARGIGAAIAETLARDGATLFVLDIPQSGADLAQVANSLKATPIQLDITAEDAPAKIVDLLKEKNLELDILIHNAGITRDKFFVNMDEQRWNQVIDVNIAAQLRINDALLDASVISDEFRLVSLASTSGVAGNAGQANYAYSKSGVMGMVAALAKELAPYGGTANAVAPGFIETEMTGKIPPMQREIFRRSNSLKQGGLPVDVAETISFLTSSAAGGIQGQTLRVCGQNLVGR